MTTIKKDLRHILRNYMSEQLKLLEYEQVYFCLPLFFQCIVVTQNITIQ